MARYVRKGAKRVRRVTRKPYRRVGRKINPSKAFAAKVKKVVAKDVETKVIVFQSNVTAFNQQINSSGDVLRLMPAIAQGVGQNQRIGSEIKLQRLNIRGVLTFTLSQATPSNTRIGVRLMILKAKRFGDWTAAQTDFGTNFGRLLEDSVNGFQGTVGQFNTPINRDYFSVVADKRFYMSQSLITANAALVNSTGDVTNTTKFVNFSMPYSRRMVKFDENYSATEPTNYPYFMVLGYSKLDGAAADATGTTYLTFQYTASAYYEDA